VEELSLRWRNYCQGGGIVVDVEEFSMGEEFLMGEEEFSRGRRNF